MTRVWAGLLALVTTLGCEKDPQAATSPTVIVGDSGAEAEAGPAPDGASPGEPGLDESGSLEIVVTEVPCQSDVDCEKDSCCHATSCVALADAPSCADTMCTMDCRAGTMDCYGGCMCQDGRCAAQLWVPPSGG